MALHHAKSKPAAPSTRPDPWKDPIQPLQAKQQSAALSPGIPLEALGISHNQRSKRPGKIAHADIRDTKQHGNVEDFQPHHLSKVIVPEGKSSPNAEVF